MLAFSKTKLGECIDSVGFFVNDYILYITRDSSTEVHVLAVFVKEWLSFACDTSMKNVGNFWLPFSRLLESHLPNINHSIIVSFYPRFTGSLVTRLVRKTCLSVQWGLNWEPFDLMETPLPISAHLVHMVITWAFKIQTK